MQRQVNFKTIVIVITILLGLATLISSKATSSKAAKSTGTKRCASLVSSACAGSSIYGALHNAGLLAISADGTNEEKYAGIIDYYAKLGYDVKFDYDWALDLYDNISSGAVFDIFLRNHYLCTKGLDYLKSVLNLAQNSDSQEDTDASIDNLSLAMQNDDNITDSEKISLCNIFGIAKGSSRFWNGAAGDIKHPWHAQSVAKIQPNNPGPAGLTNRQGADIVGFAWVTFLTEGNWIAGCGAGSFLSGFFLVNRPPGNGGGKN